MTNSKVDKAMWTVFRLINLFWLLASTYMWVTATVNHGPILVVVNAIMVICLNMMPIKFRFDALFGRVTVAILLLGIWYMWNDGPMFGLTAILRCMPVLWLFQLPLQYKIGLLSFVTKWYAILLIPALLLYWITFFVDIPSFGQFVHNNYEPFNNYIFYIKTTWDNGIFTRFNAFFLEPGHQALLSTFLIIANRYSFKKNPYNIILAVAVLFSFSLAGYLLLFIGWTLLMIKNVRQAILVSVFLLGVGAIGLHYISENNALNELIISRLEYDSEKGIKGNNRYFNNTDYVFKKAQKNGDSLLGVQDKTNMELVGGAGFKIFVLKYGWVGVCMAFILYISMIPPGFNPRYTFIFLFVICLCFIQRDYPTWYSWLLPYVLGINIHSKNSIMGNPR